MSDEFPFFGDHNSITLAHVSNIQTAQLMKVSVQMILFEQLSQVVEALCDGGSTHSFISPDVLTRSQMKIASDRSSFLFHIQNFVISNASGESKSACCVN